jgi:Wzt C-terminal domain
MRLGFAIASHLEADVLLLDEVFAVGDEAFQRKCFGKIFDFKRRGGTIVFVSHDASAVERLCQRAILLQRGEVVFDGDTHDAIVEYHRQLADERNPEEREAGLREWGSGEARIASARLLGPEGEERQQFAAGDPMTLRVELAAAQPLPPPRLSYELRDDGGVLLAGGVEETGPLGWDETGCTVRFDVAELPLSDGRFRLQLGLADASGEHLYHQIDDALSFVVYPAGGETRGLVRLEGRWSQERLGAAANTAGR